MDSVFGRVLSAAVAVWIGFSGGARASDVLDESSPNFPLGRMTRPNLLISSKDQPEMGIHAGIRFQGTAELTRAGGSTSTDFYGRRVRFEFGTRFSRNMSFAMDIRNDNANQGDEGEGNFNVGDAYVTVENLLGDSLLNFRGYRAKVDVSRTQTIKSSWQLYYDRPSVADEAAQFVSHNRRAMNAQLYGDYRKKIHYSLAIGDGVHRDTFHDASGAVASGISGQNPMVGAKILVSPLPGWEERERTETYFGVGQHASFGVGIFHTGNIGFRPTTSAPLATVSRTLLNVEASAHYRGLSLQAEYFRFHGVVEDFAAASLNQGSSDGWYAQAEYLLPELAYTGIFYRHERWNRFLGVAGYDQTTHAAGVNWYLRGNTVRVGLAAQADEFGARLGGGSRMTYRLLSQLHF